MSAQHGQCIVDFQGRFIGCAFVHHGHGHGRGARAGKLIGRITGIQDQRHLNDGCSGPIGDNDFETIIEAATLEFRKADFGELTGKRVGCSICPVNARRKFRIWVNFHYKGALAEPSLGGLPDVLRGCRGDRCHTLLIMVR